MVEKNVTIKNEAGLHMRPAGEFAKLANQCTSSVKIIYNEKNVNAKSVLNIMAAGIKCGDEITIQCDGDNESKDLNILIEAIENGLGE
ncbi:HPr family phosphocarrier protein [uncultured Tyzzerella sp.]|uniref:HPr family phosphocarrier protein n=1 Tax=uncultured Tyzzerella sp. TaxID=2321398 RepID=UPI002943B198|nr:HPr family phosphocarrier protein [uncultured Tyzzerella sp.]